MLLAIDVGNSNNVIGLFSGEKLLTHWRIRTEWNRTADEYWVLIKEFILLNDVETERYSHFQTKMDDKDDVLIKNMRQDAEKVILNYRENI